MTRGGPQAVIHTSILRWAILLVHIQTADVWPGRPEDLVTGAPDGQADIIKRPPGYVMDLGILYRSALYVSIVAMGRPWKTTGRHPGTRDILLL